MQSTISSTEFYEGKEITLTATPDSGANGNLFYWVINFTTDDLQYSIQELATQRRVFKAISSTGTNTATDTATVTQQANSINTLTPLLLQMPTTQYVGSATNTALESNSFFADNGITYNITWTNPPASTQKTISGIVTWLKQWFYTKDEVYDTGWTSLDYTTNMKDYSGQPIRIRRIGKVVHIEGAVTSSLVSGSTFPLHQQICNENNISTYSDSYNLTVGILDEQFRPSDTIYTVQQGSGMNRFICSITPQGKVRIGKYGASTDVDPQSNPWLNIYMTYMVD